MTNKNNSVLYTRVTSDLKERVLQHKAIKREKLIKAGSRNKKIDLINEMNPEWDELS